MPVAEIQEESPWPPFSKGEKWEVSKGEKREVSKRETFEAVGGGRGI
jgi:hypothetical protein